MSSPNRYVSISHLQNWWLRLDVNDFSAGYEVEAACPELCSSLFQTYLCSLQWWVVRFPLFFNPPFSPWIMHVAWLQVPLLSPRIFQRGWVHLSWYEICIDHRNVNNKLKLFKQGLFFLMHFLMYSKSSILLSKWQRLTFSIFPRM